MAQPGFFYLMGEMLYLYQQPLQPLLSWTLEPRKSEGLDSPQCTSLVGIALFLSLYYCGQVAWHGDDAILASIRLRRHELLAGVELRNSLLRNEITIKPHVSLI